MPAVRTREVPVPLHELPQILEADRMQTMSIFWFMGLPCMYVCMHVCMYVCADACIMYRAIYTYIHTHTHAHTHTHLYYLCLQECTFFAQDCTHTLSLSLDLSLSLSLSLFCFAKPFLRTYSDLVMRQILQASHIRLY